jgi:biopolymer transport protein TolR
MGVKLGGRGGGRSGFREINVTPLVDVMLVLLVVFMVTAPLLTTGLRINLPEVKAAETPVKDARLLVTVTKDEKVLFGEEDVTGRVAEAFRQNARVQTERELYIRADKDARYGIVADVVAAARFTGVESLNLLVQPELEEVDEGAEKAQPGTPGRSSAVPAEK